MANPTIDLQGFGILTNTALNLEASARALGLRTSGAVVHLPVEFGLVFLCRIPLQLPHYTRALHEVEHAEMRPGLEPHSGWTSL